MTHVDVIMQQTLFILIFFPVIQVTPLTALKFAELSVKAGFPPGVINILPGSGKQCLLSEFIIIIISFSPSAFHTLLFKDLAMNQYLTSKTLGNSMVHFYNI